MATNNAPQVVMEIRRQLVASILARRPRVTQREIWAHLAGADREGVARMVNPDTGKPFSLGTIHNDIQALREEYIEKTSEARDTWVSKLLLIYEELLMEAQKGGDIAQARGVLADIRKMLGLDSPDKLTIDQVKTVEILKIGGLDPESDV